MNKNNRNWITLVLASWAAMIDAFPANCTANRPVKCGGGTGTSLRYCKMEYVAIPIPINGKPTPFPIPLPTTDFCSYKETAGIVDSCAEGTGLNQTCGNTQKVNCTATRENTGPCCGAEPGK